KVRANAASAERYDVDVGDNSARNCRSITGNGGAVPVGNNVHEGHHQLGALLKARPGAGLFSPGVRFTTNVPVLCEDVELDGELMDTPKTPEMLKEERDRAIGNAWNDAVNRFCA